DRMTGYGPSSYAYTAAGELTRRASPSDTLTTTYDALGNLVAAGYREVSGPTQSPIAVGKTIQYLVDGENRRVKKFVDGEPVQGWIYRNGLHPAAELDGTGAVVNRFVYATQEHAPDLVLQDGVLYRVITDHLGSVHAVINI